MMRTSGFSMSSLHVRSSRISSSQNITTRIPNGDLWSQQQQQNTNKSVAQQQRSMYTSTTPMMFPQPTVPTRADNSKVEQAEAAAEKKRNEILAKTNTDKLVGKTGKYSKDLFVQAVLGNVLGQVNKDIQFLRKALEDDPSLRLALKVPKPDEHLLDNIAKEGKFNKLTAEFLYYLREDKQFKSVNSILDGFVSLYNDYNNITAAEVTVSSKASKERIIRTLSAVKADLKDYPNLSLSLKKSDDISIGYKLRLGQYEFDQTRDSMVEQRNADLETIAEGATSIFPDEWAPEVKKEDYAKMKKAYSMAAYEPKTAEEANAFWEILKKNDAAIKSAVQSGNIANLESIYNKNSVPKDAKVQLKPNQVDRKLFKKPPSKLTDKFSLTPKESAAYATKAMDHVVSLNLFKNMEPIPRIMERYREYLKAVANKTAVPPPSIKLLKPGKDGKVTEHEIVKKGTTPEVFYKAMPKYIGKRVFFNPELDQYLYDSKIAHWKLQLSEMTKDDPERPSYEKAIEAFESVVYKVNYEPPSVESNPFAFVNLIKKTPEELAQVPLEVFKRLPPNQLAQFDAKAILEAINKHIDFEPVDVEAVKKLDIEALKPVDLDVICMDINDDLRLNLRSKQIAIEMEAKTKKVNVDPLQAYTLTAAELKSKYNLNVNSSYDTRISELAELKRSTETKIKARGITPLPDRLEWFKF
eukprot:TRINITY_DN1206_c0_g1_i2.p1 TRINITY_DN1206_c0_g1~~TRINITY_DN1206_c0_g1_i2.p1  ORF type:complete len:705 (+),score=240.06 TRINITY_DN1206_c0_g1_i2:30-2117(+)